jgi:hypothetical protein
MRDRKGKITLVEIEVEQEPEDPQAGQRYFTAY